MTAILLLGFIIGLQHALEADHVAAVSSLVSRQFGVRRAATHGIVWGIGHTLTLLIVAGGALYWEAGIAASFSGWLELLVGLMLLGLGGHVLYRLWRDRIHFHNHRHADGTVHFHAHSHFGEQKAHGASRHNHVHPKSNWARTLLVGLMHGLAGSAALVVLATATAGAPANGILFVLLFGLGSIIGMAILSTAIAIPLALTARALTRAHRTMQGAIGTATASIGIFIIGQTLPTLLGL